MRTYAFVMAIGLTLAVTATMPAFAAESGAERRIPPLPSGPQGPGKFGAYYTQLAYYPEWDAPWRVGSHADVLVRFDNGGHKFIFWRGTNYIPHWVTDNNIWYNKWKSKGSNP